MSVAAFIADMVRAGVDPDLIGRAAELLAAREPVAVKDDQAERRRASDRERKAFRRIPQNSADTPSSPFIPPALSPTPPISPPYNPPPTPSLSGPASPDTDRAPVKASSKAKAGYTPEFELVWSEWPKSPTESKKLAFDRFARLSKPDRDACFDGAMAQTMWLEAETERRKGRDPPPRLHLSTFISERRWENLLNTEFNRYGRTPWPTTQAQR
jgi:hypothetical protein